MDQLIKGLKSFNLTKNKDTFDIILDESISKMSTLEVSKNEEWDKLKLNYSKLRYLNYLLKNKNLHFDSNEKFLISLGIFLKYIDSITVNYLSSIDFENDNEYPTEGKIIKNQLDNSLNCNDPIEKMGFILEAYRVLVNVAEDLKNEKFVEFIDDEDFLEKFNFKRKKIN